MTKRIADIFVTYTLLPTILKPKTKAHQSIKTKPFRMSCESTIAKTSLSNNCIILTTVTNLGQAGCI